MTKILPKDLTTQDLLKCLAVLLMVCDHVGHHLYPDEMWFRVFGRLCVPIWFFLVGYADTTAKPLYLWSAALLVQLSAIISGQFLLPLNILFTILIMRHFRNGFARNVIASPESMRGIFLILLFATLPTAVVFEYGSLVMLFVLLGFMARHAQTARENIPQKYIWIFTGLTYLSFFLTQGTAMPSLSLLQALVLFCGLCGVAYILWNINATTYPNLTKRLPFPIVALIQLMGRYSLEIYVLHILLLRAICMWLDPQTYAFMQWGWLPSNMAAGVM